jgi:RES domain-containing protein
MIVIQRGGPYFRCADPSWVNPLDGSWSMKHGGRWNAPGSYPTVYLCGDRGTAQANARFLLNKKLAATFFSADDLDPSELPVLVTTVVLQDEYADIITDAGCANVGLPTSYPIDAAGAPVEHAQCQRIGRHVWDAGVDGIACRTAVDHGPIDGEELAYFERPGAALSVLGDPERFEDWYGPIDW